MDVLHQGPWGEVKKKTTHQHSTSSFCLQSDISTTRCQSGPCDLVPVSSYVWPASSSSQPKVGQSRSIRVLYTLWLELSLLGHERVLLQEAHSVQLSGMRRKSFFMRVSGVYDTTPIHRWRAVRGRQTTDYDELVWCTNSLPWFISQHTTNWSTDWLTGWGRARLTGDSGTWSSSREKELLNALLNVSLFCLCRSMVARITYEWEEMWRTEEKGWRGHGAKWGGGETTTRRDTSAFNCIYSS